MIKFVASYWLLFLATYLVSTSLPGFERLCWIIDIFPELYSQLKLAWKCRLVTVNRHTQVYKNSHRHLKTLWMLIHSSHALLKCFLFYCRSLRLGYCPIKFTRWNPTEPWLPQRLPQKSQLQMDLGSGAASSGNIAAFYGSLCRGLV